ncbi:MAG: hypothetical protein PHI64_05315 [Zoogloea sp.]|nr:hypothetical protein [Zoogloea sp.]MDD2988364.1 hypothetical protein [Zoogloea sp.]
MSGFLKHNIWALTKRHSLKLYLEIQRCWFIGQRVLQPAKVWRLSFPALTFPKLTRAKDVRFAQRDPGQPDEGAGPVDYGDENATKDKEVLAIYHALIR